MNDQQQLEAGIAELGLTLPADAPQKLLAYRDLLLKWNKTYNLTALADPQKALTHHLLDSLAILPWVSGIRDQESGIRNPAAAKPPVTELSSVFCPLSSVLDVGSGGGLPGLVLAMACPALQVTLVDAVRKKTVFLRQAVIELGLSRVEIRHERVENLTGSYGLIVSRAFAELKDFVALTRHLVAPGGYWLAMKGQNPERELAALPDDIRAVAVEPLKIPGLAAERHLLVLRVAA